MGGARRRRVQAREGEDAADEGGSRLEILCRRGGAHERMNPKCRNFGGRRTRKDREGGAEIADAMAGSSKPDELDTGSHTTLCSAANLHER